MVIINKPQILQKLSRSKRLSSAILKNARLKVNVAQQQMVQEFNNHSVTKEIEAGIGGPTENISGTLDGVKGDLFSWFGFARGRNPISAIRNLLIKPPRVREARKQLKSNGIRYIYTVEAPNKEQIFQVAAEDTPVQVGGSWIRYIEVGMRGLKLYISIQGARKKWLKKVIQKYSRTKRALQIDIRGTRTFEIEGQRDVTVKEGRYNARFRNIPYISQILNNFRKKFKNSILN